MKLKPGKYYIPITEGRTTRLPHPYTSNCTDGNLVSNLFSNLYTVESCQETCAYDYMMRKFDGVVDDWKDLHSTGAKPLNSSKRVDPFCLFVVVDWELSGKASSLCTCRRACEETTYSTVEKRIGNSVISDYGTMWQLQLYKESAVIEVKLVRDFPGEMFLGTFGGGKFQAVFQFIVFLFLCISQIFRR